MGGRGASSGKSDNGKEYGTEYRSYFTAGNMKFVKRRDNSASAPLETMTRGRVYITLDANFNPKYISYYDNKNKRSKTIDLDHFHKGMKPHVHHGYNHNENDNVKGATNLNTKERKIVDMALSAWYNRKRKR